MINRDCFLDGYSSRIAYLLNTYFIFLCFLVQVSFSTLHFKHKQAVFCSEQAVVAEWSKALSQIQVERVPSVSGSNPRFGLQY